MAMTGHAVTDAVGDGLLREFGGRLSAQVWPGDTLRTAVIPIGGSAESRDETVEHAVKTVNQHGMTVFDGLARAVQAVR